MSTIVVRNSFCARSSALSRSLSSAKADRGRDALDQLGLVAERLVVQQRADPPAVVLHDRDRRRAARGKLERRPVPVDPALPRSSQNASPSDGSPSASASAARSGRPRRARAISPATEPRASRLRSIPNRNANGTAVKSTTKTGRSASATPGANGASALLTSSSDEGCPAGERTRAAAGGGAGVAPRPAADEHRRPRRRSARPARVSTTRSRVASVGGSEMTTRCPGSLSPQPGRPLGEQKHHRRPDERRRRP